MTIRGREASARVAERPGAALRRALTAQLREFARAMGFELVVPGTHTGGIANQRLLEILAARGWDYGADTRRLREYVRLTLLNEFADADAVPLRLEVEQVAAGAILEWVARRLERRATDIDRPALSPQYARAKRRRFGTGRAGSASGELAESVTGLGRIVFT